MVTPRLNNWLASTSVWDANATTPQAAAGKRDKSYLGM